MQQKRKQIQQYLTNHINIFIQPLVYDLVKKRPSNPPEFAIKWLENYISKITMNNNDTDSQSSTDQVPFDQQKFQKHKEKSKKRSRIGISQQVFGNFNKKDQVILPSIPKSQQQKILILGLIRNSILFSNLDQKQENTIIDAMEQKIFQTGNHVIKEGDKGDCLYIVAQGQFNCTKLINGENKYLKTYNKGQAFGELALMHNAPRAATITAKNQGRVFALDRITFSQIVKQSAIKKRDLYQNVISTVSIFSQLSPNEKQQFYDVLKQKKYDSGVYVIKQGDFGTEFYIVIQGNLIAQKKQDGDQLPKVVYQYKAGDYFGQLSLIHDTTRQASIKALTKVRLASIQRQAFKRLLGSLEDILKRNQQRYKVIKQQIIV